WSSSDRPRYRSRPIRLLASRARSGPPARSSARTGMAWALHAGRCNVAKQRGRAMTAPPSGTGFSLVRGGPFTHALLVLKLVRTTRSHPHRAALAVVLVLCLRCVWGCVMELCPTGKIPPLFADISTHLRAVASVPAFLIAEGVWHDRTAYVAARLTDGWILDD